MHEALLWDTLGFATRALITVVAITVTVAVSAAIFRRRRGPGGGHLEVAPLNQRFEALGDAVRYTVYGRKAGRLTQKVRKKAAEALGPLARKPSVFVVDFDGDLLATSVTSLRDEITAIVEVAREEDEIVVRLESSGGAVPHYGLAAAQLARVRDRKLKLTVCIDRVAASGGYMMACVANTIIAAPFAIVGSIGVVAQVPNVHRLLKKHDVDYEELTAGEFKRTVSVFAPITEAGRRKFQDQLEDTHQLFKDFVQRQRPKLEIDKVATGEYWPATRAVELGLVDKLGTSDDYLLSRVKDANLYRVRYTPGARWRERISRAVAETTDNTIMRLLSRLLSLELR